MTVFTGGLSVVAFLLWAALVANVTTMSSSDPAGRGLAMVYAVGTVIALWVTLAALLVALATRSGMPPGSKLAALVLLPLTAAGTLAAVNLLASSGTSSRWPILIPAATPLLILVYAVSLGLGRWPVERQSTIGIGLWGAVAVLSLLPWPALRAGARANQEHQAEVAKAWEEERSRNEQARRVELLAKLDKLSPDSRVWEWLELADAPDDIRARAIEGVRQSTHRQEDAELMAERGYGRLIELLPELEVEATAPICGGAAKYLRDRIASLPVPNPDPLPYSVFAERIERYLPLIQWMTRKNCDLAQEVAALGDAAKSFAPAPERERFLDTLASRYPPGRR